MHEWTHTLARTIIVYKKHLSEYSCASIGILFGGAGGITFGPAFASTFGIVLGSNFASQLNSGAMNHFPLSESLLESLLESHLESLLET